MHSLETLFKQNRNWAEQIKQEDPNFFKKLSEQQKPDYLWIGCADSRVPANQLLGLLPGDVFVHRNVANLITHTDFNCLSVVQFAVEVLQVKQIIICGHYGCGGINAAIDGEDHGLVDHWLRHVQDIYFKYQKDLDLLTPSQRSNLLCELNVLEQVSNLCRTTIVRKAWQRKQPLTVHGLIYDIQDGLLQDLNICIEKPTTISDIYHSYQQFGYSKLK